MMKPGRNIEQVRVDAVFPLPNRRPVKTETVDCLVQSIERLGLLSPITVRFRDDVDIPDEGRVDGVAILVAGHHRLEAAKRLGWSHIPAVVMDDEDITARLVEIAENLHRAELTALERDEQIAEWLRLSEAKVISDKLSEKEKRGRPGLVTGAAKAIGVHERDARRAATVDSLSPEAKQAAVDLGLDDNRSALLKAAKETTPEAQVSRLKLAAEPLNDFEAKEKQVARLMAAWNSASPEARDEFMSRIDTPVFDRGAA
jgi:ParB/RepB/Spo0J family partition protein